MKLNGETFAKVFSSYEVVLKPDKEEVDWWAGAPSVTRDDRGIFYLAARMRETVSPKGRRGYEIRILESPDGIHFQPVHSIKREEVPVFGFERPSLLYDKGSGRFKLYLCGGLKERDGKWGIIKLDDAENPKKFNPRSPRIVLNPSVRTDQKDIRLNAIGYKDPFIIKVDDEYHMYVIGTDYVERTYHFVSGDGEKWLACGVGPVFDCSGWHNFFTRPASVLPLDVGFLFVYEGSHSSWFDPVYNIATGLAYTPDLNTIVDLTPNKPILKSPATGADYHTWRYSHWMKVENEIYVYAEVRRPNGTNEILLYILKNVINK